nr:MAG: hypothetical protein [Cressdnaviricota sp.]
MDGRSRYSRSSRGSCGSYRSHRSHYRPRRYARSRRTSYRRRLTRPRYTRRRSHVIPKSKAIPKGKIFQIHGFNVYVSIKEFKFCARIASNHIRHTVLHKHGGVNFTPEKYKEHMHNICHELVVKKVYEKWILHKQHDLMQFADAVEHVHPKHEVASGLKDFQKEMGIVGNDIQAIQGGNVAKLKV